LLRALPLFLSADRPAFQLEGGSAAKAELMVVIPLAVLEAGICWWIFLCLTHTMKILSLRANNVKRQLFSRFQWVLIVAVVLTIVFAIWSIYDHYNAEEDEEPDWENAWLQDG
jgi:choline-glycine betaine transporter